MFTLYFVIFTEMNGASSSKSQLTPTTTEFTEMSENLLSEGYRGNALSVYRNRKRTCWSKRLCQISHKSLDKKSVQCKFC